MLIRNLFKDTEFAVGLKPPLVFSAGSQEENLDMRQRELGKN